MFPLFIFFCFITHTAAYIYEIQHIYVLVLLLFWKMNLPSKHKTSLFSLFKTHISFWIDVKRLKFGLIFEIISINSDLSLWYFEQINKKWCSSSISCKLHWKQTLNSGGSPIYLPLSIFNWCAEIRSLVIFFLWSKLLIIER